MSILQQSRITPGKDERERYRQDIEEIESFVERASFIIQATDPGIRPDANLTTEHIHELRKSVRRRRSIRYKGYRGADALKEAKADLKFLRSAIS